MRIEAAQLALYLVLDARVCGTRERLLATAAQALSAGVTFLQLRGDKDTWHQRDWYDVAMQLKPMCREAGVPFVINDQVDIALAVDADGVHVGQKDLPVEVVRRLIGRNKILGLSTSCCEEVCAVDKQIVDYIGMGPVFPTTSKTDTPAALGLDGLRRLVDIKKLPGVAIGGIHHGNVAAVRAISTDGIAVVSAICGQEKIADAVSALMCC